MHVGADGLREAYLFGAVLGVDKTGAAAQSLAATGAFDSEARPHTHVAAVEL
jgi:hypothetical protein